MYFPYVRGKQFELLALRELVSEDGLSRNITPIIEPVSIAATLTTTIQAFKEKNHPIAIILNPQVGSFISDRDSESPESTSGNGSYQAFVESLKSPNVIRAAIMDDDAPKLVSDWEKNPDFCQQGMRMMAILKDREKGLRAYKKCLRNNVRFEYTLIPEDRMLRRFIEDNDTKKVLFGDRFEKQPRNADYGDDEEFFSDDHHFYQGEGFKGYSDYSVIGSDYVEGGFAPYAVAIHIVYFKDDDDLYVRHFVSDSNEDISDTAGKFREALKKLKAWTDTNTCKQTRGLRAFLNIYEKGTYHGLGFIKKLSLMHHMELIGTYLDQHPSESNGSDAI